MQPNFPSTFSSNILKNCCTWRDDMFSMLPGENWSASVLFAQRSASTIHSSAKLVSYLEVEKNEVTTIFTEQRSVYCGFHVGIPGAENHDSQSTDPNSPSWSWTKTAAAKTSHVNNCHSVTTMKMKHHFSSYYLFLEVLEKVVLPLQSWDVLVLEFFHIRMNEFFHFCS